ncbi:MAG TPA: NCS1 family nucleobase:cation symporter-1 [Planctomycetota bacterium]|nr:NCS1 family nucleobase:cation symporter-1 [Planctomycetota bacterium]
MQVDDVTAGSAAPRVVAHPDGRVELALDAAGEKALEAKGLCNEDLLPVPLAKRHWTTWNFAALWISMAHCLTTYFYAAGLIQGGMDWKQALLTIAVGNVIVLVPILLNSHPGTKYGIPFPVFARAAYGTVGANLPALMRAFVACGWFGIQCWIGGKAVHELFRAIYPGWTDLLGTVPLDSIFAGDPAHPVAWTQFVSFLIFWAMNIWIIVRGMDLLRAVENWAAPFVLVMTAILLGWAVNRAGSLGAILEQPSHFKTTGAFLAAFVPGVTGMIGYWATLSLNMSDFTRYGQSQRSQAWGQILALPTTMTGFAAMGVIITSATIVIFGSAIWDPLDLVEKFNSRIIAAVITFTVVVATLAVNIAANVVSPANDFSNAFPRAITFRTGGVITGVLGILCLPWKLLANPALYINGWLIGYSGGLASIAGVLIADYWIVRRRRLDLAALYEPAGRYRYGSGWSWPAVAATLLGCLVAWAYFIAKPFLPAESRLLGILAIGYNYCWFVGLGVSMVAYLALSRLASSVAESARNLPEPASPG